jgi:hypothetical protein
LSVVLRRLRKIMTVMRIRLRRVGGRLRILRWYVGLRLWRLAYVLLARRGGMRRLLVTLRKWLLRLRPRQLPSSMRIESLRR